MYAEYGFKHSNFVEHGIMIYSAEIWWLLATKKWMRYLNQLHSQLLEFNKLGFFNPTTPYANEASGFPCTIGTSRPSIHVLG